MALRDEITQIQETKGSRSEAKEEIMFAVRKCEDISVTSEDTKSIKQLIHEKLAMLMDSDVRRNNTAKRKNQLRRKASPYAFDQSAKFPITDMYDERDSGKELSQQHAHVQRSYIPVQFKSQPKHDARTRCPEPAISEAAQMELFQQRSDLRKCILPGMLKPISKGACEGWRSSQIKRYSKQMARIKLGPCLACEHFCEPFLLKS